MTNEQLQQLRTKILSDIMPLIINSSDNNDRFDVILRLIQSGNATPDLYTRAYETALSFSDAEQKLDALMALLDEVEIGLDSEEGSPPLPEEESPEQLPTPQPIEVAKAGAEQTVTVRSTMSDAQ